MLLKHSLFILYCISSISETSRYSSVVEHFLGKEEVRGSNPRNGSGPSHGVFFDGLTRAVQVAVVPIFESKTSSAQTAV